MRQWAEIKQSYPDCLVLFRLGDFYEAFNEDAVQMAEVCDVTLTSRPVKKGERAPMAGVPYHAVDSYIAQIVKAGIKVAIVEQSGEDTSPEKRSRMSRIPVVPAQPGSDVEQSPSSSAAEESKDGSSSQPSLAQMPKVEPVAPPAERKTSRKGIMAREVVRVVTPGTILEGELLDAKAPNYLASIAWHQDKQGLRIGLSHADVSTGEFATTELKLEKGDPWRALLDSLVRLQPAEIVHPDIAGLTPDSTPHVKLRELSEQLEAMGMAAKLMPSPTWRFDLENATRVLLEHFQVRSLDSFGCGKLPAATMAAGALLDYFRSTQKNAPTQIRPLRTEQDSKYLILDAAARRTLEITETLRGRGRKGSLLEVIDRSQCPMGARTLRAWLSRPLLDIRQIARRQAVIGKLLEAPRVRMQLRDALKAAPDLPRLMNRVTTGYAGPREVQRLGAGLAVFETIKDLAGNAGWSAGASSGKDLDPDPESTGSESSTLVVLQNAPDLGSEFLGSLCANSFASLREAISQTIAEETPATLGVSGCIRRGHSAELDHIHDSVAEARAYMAGLEQVERERSGIKGLKVGFNKVFGYYLSVPKSASESVPEDYIRKQTLTGSERYITPEMKEREQELLGAEELIIRLERELFQALCATIASESKAILQAADDLGRLDALASLAEVADEERYVQAEVHSSLEIDIVGGRHPVVETHLRDTPFVPNDMRIDPGEIILLTGPNMAGKSTVGRQVALICLLAQVGSYVPADSARIGLVDRIFTRIGAQDEIASGQSTFMVEMVETAAILSHASSRSLLILDELGRGTSTYDGMSIAWSVIEYIHQHPRLRSRTLFATHYHELTELEASLERLRNMHLAVADTDAGIVFLHEVHEGPADRSYGIHVADLAGLPQDVIRRAGQILRELEAAEASNLVEGAGLPAGEGALEHSPPSQYSMFESALTPAESDTLKRLREVDPNSMTPLEAMIALAELKNRLGNS